MNDFNFSSRILILCFAFSASSLVLHLSQNVQVGSQVNFNCTATGSGLDPTFIWSIKFKNGTTVSPTLTALYPLADSNANDGEAMSQVKFVVTAEHLDPSNTKRLWCGAVDSGNVSPSIQIYTELVEILTTTGLYYIYYFRSGSNNALRCCCIKTLMPPPR